MNNRNQDKDREGHAGQTRKRSVESRGEIAGSPDGSQVSQSSSIRRNALRVVELLPELISRQSESSNPSGQDDWMIRAEFYDEDIGAEEERMSNENHGDDDDDDDDVDEEDQDLIQELDQLDELENINEDEVYDDDDFDDDDDDMIDAMGFVLAPGIEDGDTSDDDLDDDENQVADYDTTLPIGHHYLGDNLEESGGTQVFPENSTLNLPLFNLSNIVLLPGQVLPITTTNMTSSIHESLKMYLDRRTKLIGLISDPRENSIGTTAEIRNYHQQESEIRLILEGRQRFQLPSSSQTPFETIAERIVKILPEVRLGRPYLLPPSRRKLSLNNNSSTRKIIVSRHPLWLLRKYEATHIVKKILDQIRDWCTVDLTTRDPNDLSYWVAANLPISNEERISVLRFNCTEQRLLWLLDLLERSEFFGCSSCRNVICYKKDVFTMSSSGPQNSFVNSSGFVHDTLTVRRTRGLIQEPSWSDEYCWFPGYEWSIVSCDNCSRHIGWCYKSSTLRPKRFFGLSRAYVRLQSESGGAQSQDERINRYS